MSEIDRRAFLGRGLGVAAAGVTAAAIGAPVLAACSSSKSKAATGSSGGGTLAKLKGKKSVTLGIANERPYSYVDENGKSAGLVIDLAKAILTPLGITTVLPIVGTFDSLIPGLQAGHFDLIGAGLYIKPERCKVVDFTNPLYGIGESFLVRAGNPKNLHGLKDVAANSSAKIGSSIGSNQVAEMQNAGIPKGRTVLFTTDQQALQALLGGRIDVVYYPPLENSALLQTSHSNKIEIVQEFEQIIQSGKPLLSYAALAAHSGGADFITAMDGSIAKLMADGTVLTILQKYGLTKNELPGSGVTSTSLCAA